MAYKSRLHIPRAAARPGEKPDFSYLKLSPAGAIDKPSIDARTQDILVTIRMDHLAESPAASLSGGQKKLLEIGMIMMTYPQFLLLD